MDRSGTTATGTATGAGTGTGTGTGGRWRTGSAATAGPVLLCLALLGGCATGRGIDSAADIGDDGKRNTVLLSYAVRLDTFDRDAGVDGTNLTLRCAGDGALDGNPICFPIAVPFEGRRTEEGLEWNTFAAEGAELFRLDQDDHVLYKAMFDVTIGREPRTNCHEDKKGETSCYTIYVDREESFNRPLPLAHAFTVAPGRGCHLGHLELIVRGGEIVRYELDRRFDPAAFERLPPPLQARAREHVTGSCTGPGTGPGTGSGTG